MEILSVSVCLTRRFISPTPPPLQVWITSCWANWQRHLSSLEEKYFLSNNLSFHCYNEVRETHNRVIQKSLSAWHTNVHKRNTACEGAVLVRMPTFEIEAICDASGKFCKICAQTDSTVHIKNKGVNGGLGKCPISILSLVVKNDSFFFKVGTQSGKDWDKNLQQSGTVKRFVASLELSFWEGPKKKEVVAWMGDDCRKQIFGVQFCPGTSAQEAREKAIVWKALNRKFLSLRKMLKVEICFGSSLHLETKLESEKQIKTLLTLSTWSTKFLGEPEAL